MGTITAQILAGRGHQNHDGIIPNHYLFLSENDRPAWIMVNQNVYQYPSGNQPRLIWIPTVENMLEDALLMLAIHGVQAPEMVAMYERFVRKKDAERIFMYEDFTEVQRAEMYQQNRKADFGSCKIVLTILKMSSIERQIPILAEYKMDVEVCAPKYTRLYSQWDRRVRETGSLR
jgi:hypothetical protein